jgi:hypothetical protein
MPKVPVVAHHHDIWTPPPPGRLRKPSTKLATARTMMPRPSGYEKILARMVAIPKRTPLSARYRR